jgi:site-specific recombinase XerD
MTILQEFSEYLFSNQKQISQITIKNYIADVTRFVKWIEKKTGESFTPSLLSFKLLEEYKSNKDISVNDSLSELSSRSFKRHLSALRKFMEFLVITKRLHRNPLASNAFQRKEQSIERNDIKQFKDFLFNQKLSSQTIKNYIIDIQQFLLWIKEVQESENKSIRTKDADILITSPLISEYKTRLLSFTDFSPSSINRKLSSIRKYIEWNQNISSRPVSTNSKENLFEITNISKSTTQLIPINNSLFRPSDQSVKYSPIPPIRLVQKIYKMYDYLIDEIIILPLGKGLKNLIVFFKKPEIFTIASKQKENIVTNIQKKQYALLSNTSESNFYKKITKLPYLKNKQYNRYQNASFSTFIPFIGFCTVIIGVTYILYNSNFSQKKTLGTSTTINTRTISFKGRLTDITNTPLTGTKPIRFSLYNSTTASGSALLWQEVQPVNFDNDGNFSVLLGNMSPSSNPLTQDLFSTNDALYVGITIGTNQELFPREQLTNVSYASNANTVQGLAPSTQLDSQTRNALLAVDSSGNITLAGEDGHTLQTPDGQLQLVAKQLVLTTSAGTSSDVQISPDDLGMIDLQKPIHNSTNNNNIASALGAVEIDDLFAILATSSAQSAFTVNQNGIGDIISASSSGIAKFSLKSDGTTYFGGNVGIGTVSPSSLLSIEGTNPGKSLAIFNAIGTDQAIITASASGKAVFSVDTNGNILSGNGAKWSPLTDSPTALSIANSRKEAFVSFDTTNSRVGIGTSSPRFKMEILDNQDATTSAMITNTSSSSDADGLALKLGSITPSSSNNFVTFLNGEGKTIGTIQGNNSGGITYTSAGSDFAEYYRKEDAGETLFPGTLVCLGQNGGVSKCSSLSSFDIVGVVSNNAGFAGGINHQGDSKYVLVGLTGQLPVAIDDTAAVNDPLTVSSSGLASKAKQKGYIIGRVIGTPYIDSSTHQKMAMTSLHMTFFDPEVSISLSGDLSGQKNITDSKQAPLHDASFLSVLADTINSSVTQTKNLLVEQTATFKKVTTDSLAVGTSNVLIAGTSLQSYVEQIVANSLSEQNRLVTPLAQVSEVHTNVISPLTDKNLVIKFTQKNPGDLQALEIQNSSGSAVATISSSGDATFSATISAKNASISGSLSSTGIVAKQTTTEDLSATSATVSGTLRVKKIIADEIENSNASTSGVSAVNSSPLASTINSNIPTASSSVQLSSIKDLSAETGTFTQGLMAFGPASFSQAAISSSLSLGASMTVTPNSIDTLGTDLQIQPLKQGGISFLSGLAKIDMNGNLTVNGNASFAQNVDVQGILSTHIISPLPGDDLTIRLADIDQNSSSKLRIENATGSAVAQIDNKGNIIASGSATVNNIFTKGLTIVRSAQADTSLTQTIASSSAGTATIINGETERTIVTPYVKEGSLIYISPISDTKGVTPYVARQTIESLETESKGSFTIQIPQRLYEDIRVNWWIVN